PGDAGHALQSQISRLRRALAGVTIDSLSSGYRLSIGPGDVDVGEFERLAEDGRRALAEDHLGLAETSLGAALALWRRGPLAGARGRPRRTPRPRGRGCCAWPSAGWPPPRTLLRCGCASATSRR